MYDITQVEYSRAFNACLCVDLVTVRDDRADEGEEEQVRSREVFFGLWDKASTSRKLLCLTKCRGYVGHSEFEPERHAIETTTAGQSQRRGRFAPKAPAHIQPSSETLGTFSQERPRTPHPLYRRQPPAFFLQGLSSIFMFIKNEYSSRTARHFALKTQAHPQR